MKETDINKWTTLIIDKMYNSSINHAYSSNMHQNIWRRLKTRFIFAT